MPRQTRSIAVIIVNYGTADLAIAAVESVLAQQGATYQVTVHLLDNASPGGDAQALRLAHSEKGWGNRVFLYLETENHGFGRGNNVVLEKLAAQPKTPDYVFLLNPDAEVTETTLPTLVNFLNRARDVAIVGCAIRRPDSLPVPAAFRFPSIKSELSGAANFGPISRLLGISTVAVPAEAPSGPVDWVSGAALMARFKTLQDLNFFDPDFFLYFEETELMRRVHSAGHQVWYVAETHIRHVAGAATGMQSGSHKSKTQPGYWYDSWRLYFVKSHGAGYARLAAGARLAGWAVNYLVRTVQRRPKDGPQRFLRDFSRHVLRPLFVGDPLEARPDGTSITTVKDRAKNDRP